MFFDANLITYIYIKSFTVGPKKNTVQLFPLSVTWHAVLEERENLHDQVGWDGVKFGPISFSNISNSVYHKFQNKLAKIK